MSSHLFHTASSSNGEKGNIDYEAAEGSSKVDIIAPLSHCLVINGKKGNIDYKAAEGGLKVDGVTLRVGRGKSAEPPAKSNSLKLTGLKVKASETKGNHAIQEPYKARHIYRRPVGIPFNVHLFQLRGKQPPPNS